uniref:TSVP-8 n=1 Tax=Cotesia vestalis TaxID=217443 RepID=A0A067XK07_COTVE|nr:TSVP-8 [Cotesia vestalis]
MSKIILSIFLIVLYGLVFVTEGNDPEDKLGGPGDQCEENSDCDQQEVSQFCEFYEDEDGNIESKKCQKAEP